MSIAEKYKPSGTIAACQTEALQENKMSYILNTISKSIILLSTDMIVEYVNNAACIFFNQTSDNMIGKHVTELYGSEISPCGNNYHECPSIKSSKTENFHTSKYESRDGNMWLKTCYQVTDSEGRMINIVQTFQNITREVKAEKEKKIIESKLIHSQKMESVGKLAGGIAHDFNNIMTTILGFADLIQMEGKVDDATMGYICEIQKSGRRAATLTQQLLAFSRKQILKPELVNLNTLVRDTERMLRVLLLENTMMISNLSQQLNRVKVDPGQIVQVLMNLIINARDAMPHGGQIIIETENKYMDKFSCKFHPEIVPGDYVMLTVSDTGCGIDPEILVRVFEPFFTTKGVGKGTGLGLATVYGIIKQSGGYIYTYSELNYGTTFKIYLPKALEADCKGKDRTRVQTTLSGNERILFVEDDKSLRKIISKILIQLGYKVYQSGSGEEALRTYDKYREVGIDLLISDIIMPGMNGRELTETILEGNSNMKILYISGYTDDIIATHGVLDEGVSFLAKPFSIFDIASKIRTILDEQDGDKQGA
jgi:signal transduction histidine kinase/ActR/RegA family two-component response regulator